jgi:hypothetical protein
VLRLQIICGQCPPYVSLYGEYKSLNGEYLPEGYTGEIRIKIANSENPLYGATRQVAQNQVNSQLSKRNEIHFTNTQQEIPYSKYVDTVEFHNGNERFVFKKDKNGTFR